MMNRGKNLAFVLFVISATLILGSTTNAYAGGPSPPDDGSGDLEACLNGVNGDQICDTTDEWTGQNISKDVQYVLGESIPIRVDITLDTDELGPGFSHELRVDIDVTKKQGMDINHTFDYFTSFDRNDTPNPCFDIGFPLGCVLVDGLGLGPSSSATIDPPIKNTDVGIVSVEIGAMQPKDSFNALPPGEKLFWMFVPSDKTVEIIDISYFSEGDPTLESKTVLSVIFTTTSSKVVAAFGAHLASSNDWKFTAADVEGQPYKVSCVEVNGGNCNAHINIASSDILPLPPTITLVKEVTNENLDGRDFGLRIDGELVDSGVAVDVTAGDATIIINEDGLAGYKFVDITGNAKCPDSLGDSIKSALADDEDIIHFQIQL